MFAILKEVLKLLSILLATTFLTFILLYTSPGDAAENILISHDMVPTAEAVESIRREYGLDRPFLAQYGTWLQGVAVGDFGYSHSAGSSVLEEFKSRAPQTFFLAGYAIALTVLLSFVGGILAAVYRGSIFDYTVRFASSLTISIPSFWMGLMLIILFVVHLNWFEITKMHEPRNIILPAAALSLPLIGRYIGQIRAAFIEQLSSDYVAGAKARGVRRGQIVFNHILPNAIITTLPPLGITIGAILGGTFIVETIFSIPGLGDMALAAIHARDYPLIKSYVVFMTVIYILITFIIEQACKWADPRLKFEGGDRG